MATGKLQISERYFREITRTKYRSSLGYIFARETTQNAYDAEATRIDFRTGRDESGAWIEVADNGSGMDTVLKMLSIGAATKASGAGGFGTAKEIVLFSWKKWELESNYERVTSEIVAAEAEVERLSRKVRGTRIKIWHDDEIGAHEIRNYLRLVNGIRTTLDGEVITGYRKGILRTSYDWADIYVSSGDKAPERGRIVVRWEGLTMFTDWLDRDDLQVTVQLKGRCIDVLTETRESLRYPWNQEVWRIRRTFDNNPLSRNADPKEDEIDLFVGNGVFTLRASEKDSIEDELLQAREEARREREQAKSTRSHAYEERVQQAADSLTQAYRSGHSFEELFPGQWIPGEAPQEDQVPLGVVARNLPEDVKDALHEWMSSRTSTGVATLDPEEEMYAETTEPKNMGEAVETHPGMRGDAPGLSKPQRFGPRQPSRHRSYPRDYAIKRANGRKYNLDLSQEKYGRMLWAWEASVEAAIRELNSIEGYDLESRDLQFRVGFVVGGSSRAENLTVGSHRFFLLNPREVRTSASLTDIGKHLLALASHEVAHIFYGHGEAFDALWMELMARMSLSDLMSDDRVRCLSSTNRGLVKTLVERFPQEGT